MQQYAHTVKNNKCNNSELRTYTYGNVIILLLSLITHSLVVVHVDTWKQPHSLLCMLETVRILYFSRESHTCEPRRIGDKGVGCRRASLSLLPNVSSDGMKLIRCAALSHLLISIYLFYSSNAVRCINIFLVLLLFHIVSLF